MSPLFPQVFAYLDSVGLAKYYPLFEKQDIGPEEFVSLTVQDYEPIGIHDLADKKTLYRLVMTLKRNQVHGDAGQKIPPNPVASPPRETIEEESDDSPQPRSVEPVDLGLTAQVGHLLNNNQRIRVVVRKRPLSIKEYNNKELDIVTADSVNQITVHEPKVKVDLRKYTELHTYLFDEVFDSDVPNEEVYCSVAKPLISHIFHGGRATCFAFGATGAGKTHTMMERESGIYVLAASDIFKELQRPKYQHIRATVAFFEIYGGKLFDLLNNRQRLWARESAKGEVCIAHLVQKDMSSVDEMLKIIDYGLQSRSVGSTGVNSDSSRSHAILQIQLKDTSKRNAPYGKMSFIDLAGSERAADTQNSDRRTRMEGAEINKSLLALKECIRAMDMQAVHTPFRGSKLTMVLKDSFLGDAKTVMIANIAPNTKSSENTLNTLRYSDRVKELRGNANAGRLSAAVRQLPAREDINVMGKKVKKPREPRQIPAPHQQQQRFNQQRGDLQSRGPAPVSLEDMRNASHRRLPSTAAAEGVQSRSPVEQIEENDELLRTHEDVVSRIIDIEEDIIQAHRGEVDEMMGLVKQEVALLHKIEHGAIDVDYWADDLEKILAKKMESISALRGKLQEFQRELQREAETAAQMKN